MCGIFGIYDRSGASPDLNVVEKMSKPLIHRGPDDFGYHNRDGIIIGNRRLSIIDIDQGHQPFVSNDNMVAVVQNGEIFNYIELSKELREKGIFCRTHSDTEVLLRLYELEGPDFVKRLNGMFAIAIHDARRKELWLFRDRVGVKPLYYYDDGARLMFASEIKSLLALDIPRRLNHEGLHHYLSFNYVPPPFTLFQNIYHLPPGHRMRLSEKGTVLEAWWDLAQQHVEKHTDKEWVDLLKGTLNDSVHLRMRSDVPFGAFLSGGIDSSSIVGTMARQTGRPVMSFSIGFKDPRFDESMYSDRVAQLFHTNHVMERVEPNLIALWPLVAYFCDQPHGDASFMPTYRLAELASKKVKVVLTGDGGDELFAGYDRYLDFMSGPDAESDQGNFERAYFKSISLLDDVEKARLYTPKIGRELSNLESFGVIEPFFHRSRHMDRINQILFVDTMLLLSGNNLVKPDRMGMAVSLEARTPFLDYRMVELAFRMAGSHKLRNGQTKVILKHAMEPLLGTDLVNRRKQMFTVPIGEWFKHELADFTRAILLSDRSRERGLFLPGQVENLLNQHQAGQLNHTRIIRALMALEIWSCLFLDKHFDHPPTFTELGFPEPEIPHI